MQDVQQIINQAIDAHSREEAEKYQALKEDIHELKSAVNDLLTMWNQTKGVLSFIKWVVGACASLGAIFVFFRDHLK